ncbi:hypothetical protein BDA99DRAFT_541519 [Phascolomyces articulosus]|uniref:Uncharacterized protein n=1 Tax=Phascolomyces articulosus TaxID=60185 RepID=A0AAD5JSJ2_9FUNG|nr:hypothetical protein BDA99DRAFT_541519 [Phascolomyces articulosus]
MPLKYILSHPCYLFYMIQLLRLSFSKPFLAAVIIIISYRKVPNFQQLEKQYWHFNYRCLAMMTKFDSVKITSVSSGYFILNMKVIRCLDSHIGTKETAEPSDLGLTSLNAHGAAISSVMLPLRIWCAKHHLVLILNQDFENAMPIIYETDQWTTNGNHEYFMYDRPPKKAPTILPRPDFMPTKLVRVSDMKVVYGSQVKTGYCALSYCWKQTGAIELDEITGQVQIQDYCTHKIASTDKTVDKILKKLHISKRLVFDIRHVYFKAMLIALSHLYLNFKPNHSTRVHTRKCHILTNK